MPWIRKEEIAQLLQQIEILEQEVNDCRREMIYIKGSIAGLRGLFEIHCGINDVDHDESCS